MSILITGGGGLLGEAIEFGHKPSKHELNLLNYEKLSNYILTNNITEIIHAAGKVGGVNANTKYIFDFFNDNLEINLNILKACKEFKLNNSTFFLSTCIFPHKANLPLVENYIHQGEPHPTNYGYAYAKRMLEVGNRCLAQQYSIKTRSIIPCNMYGKNDNYNIDNGHVIPSLIHKCYLAKQTNTDFIVWGSGKAEREFLYANDMARILKHIHIDKKNEIPDLMLISDGKIYSIEQIVYYIIKILKFNGKVIFDSNKPEGILKKNTDNTLFKEYFYNFKFTEIETGLTETIEYFVSNYDNVRK